MRPQQPNEPTKSCEKTNMPITNKLDPNTPLPSISLNCATKDGVATLHRAKITPRRDPHSTGLVIMLQHSDRQKERGDGGRSASVAVVASQAPSACSAVSALFVVACPLRGRKLPVEAAAALVILDVAEVVAGC
eukprot:CAMPEP_0119466428 /NCGR_PEP_ID=MMETSP1344-20130328/1092_1 /TAXON_ID=236787 /ORGANISM="Florenciella parvula, Strain CCMP2471" /LENGTH=133 /DNA_ID=CAMNT_0007498743 /DNA_START=272 /DNA_END=673 /DNA_ORIENTATION=-